MAPHNEIPETENFSALEAKLIQVLKDHAGVKDEIERIDIHEPAELKGEHMATATVYGKVIFKDKSLKDRNIFIKKFSPNALHTEFVKQCKFMDKESSFFNEFLPYARKFCENNTGNSSLLDCFPKHLYGDDEIVVMDNLVLDDTFVMLSKEDKQDFDTAKIVLQHLANFHAVTYSMIKEVGADGFRNQWELNCTESFDAKNNPYMTSMFDNSCGTCLTILQKFPMDGQSEAINYITNLIGKTYPEIEGILRGNAEANDFVVLNHGDCWNNNMLFKLDPETKKVTDHIFVDFQITRFGSPCLDLGYFLFTSVKPEIRRSHLKELLQAYFDKFTKTLESLGTNCGLSFEDFFEDYKKNSRLGFMFNLMVMSAIGAFKEIDYNSMGNDPEKVMEMFNKIINDWLDKNPDKTESIAKELIAVVREEKELVGTN